MNAAEKIIDNTVPELRMILDNFTRLNSKIDVIANDLQEVTKRLGCEVIAKGSEEYGTDQQSGYIGELHHELGVLSTSLDRLRNSIANINRVI